MTELAASLRILRCNMLNWGVFLKVKWVLILILEYAPRPKLTHIVRIWFWEGSVGNFELGRLPHLGNLMLLLLMFNILYLYCSPEHVEHHNIFVNAHYFSIAHDVRAIKWECILRDLMTKVTPPRVPLCRLLGNEADRSSWDRWAEPHIYLIRECARSNQLDLWLLLNRECPRLIRLQVMVLGFRLPLLNHQQPLLRFGERILLLLELIRDTGQIILFKPRG